MNFLALIGRFFLSFFEATGRLTLFVWAAMGGIFRPPFYWKQLRKQLIEIGYYSLPVVGMTAIFTGAALALQTYSGFSRFNAESSIAIVVVLAITRKTDKTCATEVVFAALNIRRDLPLNQPVAIEFMLDKPGEVAFVCGMNMLRGSLVVQ